MRKENYRYICENPRNYHFGTEVSNFKKSREEPYEECGRYCDECPYLTVVKEWEDETGKRDFDVVRSGYPEW